MKKLIFIPAAISVLSLAGCGTTTTPNSSVTPPSSTSNQATQKPAQQLKFQNVYLTVMPGGKLGPDGKLHDAFSPANFTVIKGIPVKLTIYNYDTMKHSVTTNQLNLNVQANPAKKNGVPGITTFTFTPSKVGNFTWNCIDPCDLPNNGWSMSHTGYMMGTIHVVQ